MVDNLIRLFDASDNIFLSNGIGCLTDAISCVVTECRNGQFELEMTYPITGIRYSEIKLRSIIVAKSTPYSKAQPFRVYSITRPIDGIVTINAEHISYDLNGYPIGAFSAESAALAFNKLNELCVVSNPFTFFTDVESSSKFINNIPTSIRSLLGGMEGSFLDLYGGEYEFDEFRVKLLKNRGNDNGVTIRYGKNLTDLKQEENCASVYTGVYPFWYSEEYGLVELPEKVLNADGTFDFVRILSLDTSQEWYDVPSVDQLRAYAQQYMKSNKIGVPKVSLTVSFVQLDRSYEYSEFALLEKINLCDTVTVEFPELNVKATSKCIKTEYDVLSGLYKSIDLGEPVSSLATTIISQEKTTNKVVEKTSSAIENATNLIVGNLGGYVVLHSSTKSKQPDEILIMDEPSIEKASKVWRWNKGGLGYSDNGYSGPYKTAITQNGEIVADMVKAGEFDGAIIKTNSISGEALNIEFKDSIKIYADSKVAKGSVSTEISAESDSVSIKSNRLSIESDNFKLSGSGDVDASGAFATSVVSDGGNEYRTALRASKVELTKNNSELGTIGYVRNGTKEAYAILAGPMAVAAFIGYKDYEGKIIAGHYVNNGLNPGGHTQRNIFAGDSYFASGLYLWNGTSIGTGTAGGQTAVYMPDGLYVAGNLSVGGTKNRIVESEHFGQISMNAVESAGAYFCDIGGGTIRNGFCEILLDIQFEETIDSKEELRIQITNTSSKKIFNTEKKENGFLIYGEDGATFDWVIYAKQRGYQDIRMYSDPIYRDSEDTFDDSIFYDDFASVEVSINYAEEIERQCEVIAIGNLIYANDISAMVENVEVD